jgi:penicillin-binding protein 1A
VYSKPMAITKVVLADGKVDKDAGWGKPHHERAVPDWVASTVTQVLEQNMLYGTGRGAHVSGHTDAGKTGTTDNYADAWFSGYTPRLEATVWIGYAKGEIPMLHVHGIAVSGPTFPASIWHLYMSTAIGNRPDVPFPAPRTQADFASWRGQYEYGLAYGTSTTTTGSTTTGTTPRVTNPTTRAQTSTVAPTTTVPSPPTVEQPPTTSPDTTATSTP